LLVYLGPRGRRALALLAASITLVFCGALAGYGAAFWYEAWVNDWHAQTVWRPALWIPYFALPLGMGLLVLQCLAQILELVTGRAAPLAGEGERS
jgi:TRAP-type C4-dicarboxylate transport system permease small subunit